MARSYPFIIPLQYKNGFENLPSGLPFSSINADMYFSNAQSSEDGGEAQSMAETANCQPKIHFSLLFSLESSCFV